jgi:hypothetical protein
MIFLPLENDTVPQHDNKISCFFLLPTSAVSSLSHSNTLPRLIAYLLPPMVLGFAKKKNFWEEVVICLGEQDPDPVLR